MHQQISLAIHLAPAQSSYAHQRHQYLGAKSSTPNSRSLPNSRSRSNGNPSTQLLTPPASPVTALDDALEEAFKKLCEESMDRFKVRIMTLHSPQRSTGFNPIPTYGYHPSAMIHAAAAPSTTPNSSVGPGVLPASINGSQSSSGFSPSYTPLSPSTTSSSPHASLVSSCINSPTSGSMTPIEEVPHAPVSCAYTICITGDMQNALQARAYILRKNPTKISETIRVNRNHLLTPSGELKTGLRGSLDEIMSETRTQVTILGTGSSSNNNDGRQTPATAGPTIAPILPSPATPSTSEASNLFSGPFSAPVESGFRNSVTSPSTKWIPPYQTSQYSYQVVTIEIIGAPLNVDWARIAILALADKAAGLVIDTLEMDPKLHYVVAGRKHEELHQVMRATGTNVYLPNPMAAVFDLQSSLGNNEDTSEGVSRSSGNQHNIEGSRFQPLGTSLAVGSKRRYFSELPHILQSSSIVISGEPGDVGKAKEHLSTLVCGKSLRAETVTVQPRKIDWMLLNRRDALVQAMRDNGTFVAMPELGSFNSLVTVYGDSVVFIKRTIRMVSRITCECNIASLRLLYPGYGMDVGYNHSSTYMGQPKIADMIGQIAQQTGAEILYNNSFLDIHGQESSVSEAFRRLSSLEATKFSQQEAKFQIELAKEHREFISGKKNGKLNKIIRSTGVKISCDDLTEYNMNLEVQSNYPERALEAHGQLKDELPSEISFHVPESYHKRIIGVGGKNIQRIMKRFGVFVKFSNVEEHRTLGGYFQNHHNVIARTPLKNARNLHFLEEAVLELVYPKDKHVHRSVAVIPVSFHRALEDKAAEIETATDVKIEFPNREGGSEAIVVTGHQANVTTAVQLLHDYAPEDFEWRINANFPHVHQLVLQPHFSQYVAGHLQREYGITVDLRHPPPTNSTYDQITSTNDARFVFRCPRKRIKFLEQSKKLVQEYLRANGVQPAPIEGLPMDTYSLSSCPTSASDSHPDSATSTAMDSFKHFNSKILAVSTAAASDSTSQNASPVTSQPQHPSVLSYTWFPSKNELYRGRLASSAPNLRAIFSRNLFTDSHESLASMNIHDDSPMMKRKFSAVLDGEQGYGLPRTPSTSSLASTNHGQQPGPQSNYSGLANNDLLIDTSGIGIGAMNGFQAMSISSQMPEGMIEQIDHSNYQQTPSSAHETSHKPAESQSSSPLSPTVIQRILLLDNDGGHRGVQMLLEELELSKYLNVFVEQEVDLALLLTLGDADLRELGVTTFGSRRKLINAIQCIQNARSSPHSSVSPTSPGAALQDGQEQRRRTRSSVRQANIYKNWSGTAHEGLGSVMAPLTPTRSLRATSQQLQNSDDDPTGNGFSARIGHALPLML